MTSPIDNKTPGVPHTLKMSRLSNSSHYFFELVFVLQAENKEGYRLIVYHNGYILGDLPYGTVRGARIAYSKYCERKAFSKKVKTEWTHPYFPEKEWLDHILSSPRKLQIEGKTSKDALGDVQ